MDRHELAGESPGASEHSPRQPQMVGETAQSASSPDMPGYAVVRTLGRGGTGDVWLVREHATGELAAAKLVRRAGVGDAYESAREVRRELRVRRAHAHPHLLEVRDVVPCRVGSGTELALVAQYAAGGSLARLVRVRGRLSVGETVTSVGPIAQALAALHAEGTSHHDVSPANILFTVEGKPLLSDFGTAQMVGDGAAQRRSTPGFEDPAADNANGAGRGAGDVYGLGAVAWFCLTGRPPVRTAERPPLTLVAEDVPAELAIAIDAALAEVPRDRPTAAEFARAVFRSARAAPVDLAPAVDAEVLPELVTRLQPEAQRRLAWIRLLRRRHHVAAQCSASRRTTTHRARMGVHAAAGSARLPWLPLVAATGILIVAGLGWALAGWTAGNATAPVPAGRPTVAWARLPESLKDRAQSDDPVQAVQALAEIRALAVSTSSRELLGRVNASGSEAAAADASLLDRLDADGERLEGFTARVVEASLEPVSTPEQADSRQAVVRARVVSSGYAVVGADGRERKAPAAGRDQTLRVVVEQADDGWRVARILPL